MIAKRSSLDDASIRERGVEGKEKTQVVRFGVWSLYFDSGSAALCILRVIPSGHKRVNLGGRRGILVPLLTRIFCHVSYFGKNITFKAVTHWKR
jgi:hypothetical protein